ncbi:kinase-like domain-containing protein [Aspergillus aurantiobrunneus]
MSSPPKSTSSIFPLGQPAAAALLMGKSISREDLFKYTNGRFLTEEEPQFSRRYVRFDLNQLCNVVGSISGDRSSVSKIEKMEGGFSKALLMTTAAGSQYIVKIPCPNAGRRMYCTASEVAVLDLIRTRTSIPVPKVLAWSSDRNNVVGAEYIVMERVPGVQIFKKWEGMGESNRISFIKGLTQWEHELSKIEFPAYGSLYYKSFLTDSEMIALDPSIDPAGKFCIGPSCDPSWLTQLGNQPLPAIHCGPWRTLSDMGNSLIARSLCKVTQKPNLQLPRFIYGSPEHHSSVLKIAKDAMPALANSPKILANSQPSIWHTDLHIGNIFVSEDDPGNVTGLIDWQNTSISPLFLQVRWPVFLRPPDDYQEVQVMPALPPGFDDMDYEEKEHALFKKAKATWTKAYEMATFLNDRKAWRAMQVPSPFKEMFRRCGTTWDEGCLPLQETLIELFQGQEELGLPRESLSLSFTDDQIVQHRREFEAYEEWHSMCTFVKEILDTDADGWIAPERDLVEMRSRNMMLFEYYVSKLAATKSSDHVRMLWPFTLRT